MRIKKIKDSYNDYQCEMSFGQLMAIKNALANDHSDPLADELYAELEWYLANVPGPGESEDDLKKAEEAASSGMDSPEAGEHPTNPADDHIPPAPSEEEGPPEGPPEEGQDLDGGEGGAPSDREGGHGEGEGGGEGGGETKRFLKAANDRLPPPPAD